MNTPVKTNSTRVGKLMLGHNWYFAAAVPEEDVSKYREGALVTLDFHLSGTSPVEAVVWNVNKDQEKGGADRRLPQRLYQRGARSTCAPRRQTSNSNPSPGCG